MKTFKERYRRIPIALVLSPQYEGLSSDSRLVFLTLIISPYQTPAGVFDGTVRGLAFETGLDDVSVKRALAELETSGMIEPVSSGGWWVKGAFEWQVCNASYERAAIRILSKKWPELLSRFEKHNAAILGRQEKDGAEANPQTRHRPPTDPPLCNKESEKGSGSGTKQYAGEGCSGLQGGGGVAATRPGGLDAPAAAAPQADEREDGSNGAVNPPATLMTAFLTQVPDDLRGSVESLLLDVRDGKLKPKSVQEVLRGKIPDLLIEELLAKVTPNDLRPDLSHRS